MKDTPRKPSTDELEALRWIAKHHDDGYARAVASAAVARIETMMKEGRNVVQHLSDEHELFMDPQDRQCEECRRDEAQCARAATVYHALDTLARYDATKGTDHASK